MYECVYVSVVGVWMK